MNTNSRAAQDRIDEKKHRSSVYELSFDYYMTTKLGDETIEVTCFIFLERVGDDIEVSDFSILSSMIPKWGLRLDLNDLKRSNIQVFQRISSECMAEGLRLANETTIEKWNYRGQAEE